MPPVYSKRVLYFPLQNNSNEHNEHISHLLLAALRSTVEELPFLAGSVVPFSKEQPWLHDLRPHGAAYLEVKDLSQEIKFLNLRKARFSSSLLDSEQLCQLPERIYVRDGPIDVCHLQATLVDGGLLLVVSIIHTVCDRRGISDVLKVFADKCRKARAGELASRTIAHEEMPKHTYSIDRTNVLSGNGLPGAIENHPAWTASPFTYHGRSANRIILVPSSSASAAINISHPPNGQQAHSSDQATSISTHDAIAALIWRSIMLPRHRAGLLSAHTTTHFTQAVDCCIRLHLPEPYFGNANYVIKASLALPDLASTVESFDASRIVGVQAAARAIRAELSGVTGTNSEIC
ncbi:hypothetical protein MMC22_008572 [Lobaria immixta]|nr:hypothetical protein [Lobaria immixta]